ncbi:MAG: hypothetical protein ACR2OM_11030, partial [Aestuariivirgaceae bacterium]
MSVFGSIELKTNKVHGGKQWRDVLKRVADEKTLYRACDENKVGCPKNIRAWRTSVRFMEQFEGWNLLAAVNAN